MSQSRETAEELHDHAETVNDSQPDRRPHPETTSERDELDFEGVVGDEARDETAAPTTAHGITDGDREQIEAFLEKPRHERSVDDLRPPPNN